MAQVHPVVMTRSNNLLEYHTNNVGYRLMDVMQYRRLITLFCKETHAHI